MTPLHNGLPFNSYFIDEQTDLSIGDDQADSSLHPESEAFVLNLNLSFDNQKVIKFDFDEQDVFTQMTFKELLSGSRRRQMPYFFAVTKDNKGKIDFFDAFSMFYERTIHHRFVSPLTKQPIVNGMVYVMELDSNSPLEFCPLASLNEDNPQSAYYIKSILVTSLDMASDKRGELCYYLGGFYERCCDPANLEKAEFWYRKAAENQYFAVHLAFARWYQTGTHFPKSYDKCIEELQEALRLSPPDAAPAISQLILENSTSS